MAWCSSDGSGSEQTRVHEETILTWFYSLKDIKLNPKQNLVIDGFY